jgi:hypothetical protein
MRSNKWESQGLDPSNICPTLFGYVNTR